MKARNILFTVLAFFVFVGNSVAQTSFMPFIYFQHDTVFVNGHGYPVFVYDLNIGPITGVVKTSDSTGTAEGSYRSGKAVTDSMLTHWTAITLNTAKEVVWSKTGTDLSPANVGDDLLLNTGETLSISDMTTGSIPFIGASGLLSQDNSNLFWDNVNKRLGIGTTAPDDLLDLRGGNFVLSNSGITHPMTDLFPTNVYGGFFPNSDATGGLVIDGLSDHLGASGMIIRGFIGSTNPTDVVAAVGFCAGKSNGSTGKADLGALETAYQFSNNDNTVKYMTILGNGSVFVNDVANSKMTKGLTINQGASDDEVLSLKSSDVNHSMTNLAESDTYFSLKKLDAGSGGVNIRGLSDADHPGLVFQGVMGTASPTNSNPAIKFQGMKYNGATGAGGMADDETVLAVQNGGTVVFSILGSGNVGMRTIVPKTELDIDDGRLHISASPGTDHTWTGDATTLTVGENVVFGEVLYIKSDGKLWKADASVSTTMPGLFLAGATISADASGVVIMPGSFVRDDTWTWTAGGAVYVSETSGELTQTAPSDVGDQVQIVGYATHADRIFFYPSSDVGEI